MKILVLGAGAIGGYFGGRLVQAGADVTFLVRERRAQQLRANGLVVRSPHGDFTVPARTLVRAEAGAAFDLVLLTCKAYDLESAIEAITPAVGASTCVLPLLNGIAHIERLVAAFGAARVAGGSCAIPATLTAQGEVVQLGTFHSIVFGRLPGTGAEAGPKLEALRALYAATPVPVELSDDMMTALWEKFVVLATLAAMTCLMRAPVGAILKTDDGAALTAEALDACRRTAEAAGFPPRAAALDRFRTMFGDRASTLTASMLRDLEAGGRTEGAHIVGDMLRRAQTAGVDPGPLRAAWCHLQAADRIREQKAASADASAETRR
ncbi:MAG TPA: 2-dehydropantoate 2-reductase [Caldimonas sp.]|nr:2-dehydropantoate 2-reductase [Caldimonas sp.]